MLLSSAKSNDELAIFADSGVPYPIAGRSPFNAPHPMPFTVDSGNPEQSCHPTVVDFGPDRKFGGYRYWMSVTDYGGQHNGENPHILCSNDPYNFAWPEGVQNPLWTVEQMYDLHPDMSPLNPDVNQQWNSDPELVYDQDKDSLALFYREMWPSGGKERLWLTTSSDGRTWSIPELLQEFDNERAEGDGLSLLSPCIVKVAKDDWRMICWGEGAGMRRAKTMYGPWSKPESWKGDGSWHGSVYYKDGVFYGFGGLGSQDAFVSYDGVNWVRRARIISPSKEFERGGMYRGFITPHEDGKNFRVWYGTQWPFHIAYTVLPKSLWGEG